MITTRGKFACDAEIGKIGNWHTCGKRASVECRGAQNIVLHFCESHRNRATEEGRTLTKELTEPAHVTQEDIQEVLRRLSKLEDHYEYLRDSAQYESSTYWHWHDKAVVVTEFMRALMP